MDEAFCLYALTRADCRLEKVGTGVDPRFPVESVRYGRLAALTSRVGLDVFDLTRLEAGTADMAWLGRVATRHNEIIAAVASRTAVLPMRLGIFFDSRESMIARLSPCEANAAEFLDRLEDRQEWAAKIYVDKAAALRGQPSRNEAGKSNGQGAGYLAARGLELERRRQLDVRVEQAISTVEARLARFVDACQRLRPLSRAFTNRPDEMVWNGAVLLRPSGLGAFRGECEQLGRELAGSCLSVETTGPWPPYHFCPDSLTPETSGRTSHVGTPVGHIPQLRNRASVA